MQSLVSWFEKHNKLSWIVTILIAIVIFYISSLTFKPAFPTIGFNWKPIAYHFYAFLFLAGFLLISLTRGKKKESIFLAIRLAILYAIIDEVHQIFIPGRAFAFADILTDSAGIFFASVLYLLLRFNKPNNYKNKTDYKEIKKEILK